MPKPVLGVVLSIKHCALDHLILEYSNTHDKASNEGRTRCKEVYFRYYSLHEPLQQARNVLSERENVYSLHYFLDYCRL